MSRHPAVRGYCIGLEVFVEGDNVVETLQEDLPQCNPADGPLAFGGIATGRRYIDDQKSVEAMIKERDRGIGLGRRSHEVPEAIGRQTSLKRPIARLADVQAVALQPV